MNRHNFTPQTIFFLGVFLLIITAIILQLFPVSASAAEITLLDADYRDTAIDWEDYIEEPIDLKPVLSEQQADDLAALRHNSDIFLYGVIPISICLFLSIGGVIWFYRTFIDAGF